MDHSTNLNLPYIAPAQALKHVTHNEAIQALDTIVQLSVIDRNLSTAPGAPTAGDRYVVNSGASGAWAGKETQIAAWQNGAWAFFAPRKGWLLWIADENKIVVWDATEWKDIADTVTNPTSLVGINTTADTSNRLSLSSPASLFNHEGNGHQLKINKNTSGDTASSLYQTGFSGRAEMGLTGDDDFHFKVSPDGSAWHDAILIDKNTGVTTLPSTNLPGNTNILINGDGQINQRNFAGGTLASTNFGFDRWYADGGAADLSVSGYIWTLASGTIAQKTEPVFWGYTDFATTKITLSVTDLTGGNLNITIGSNTGTISAGSGQRAITITTAGGDTGNLTIKLSPTAGTVNFKHIKAEVSAHPTPRRHRTANQEMALAQRYYERLTLLANERFATGIVIDTSPGNCRFPIEFQQTKPSATANISLSATADFSIEGPGFSDVADGFSTLETSSNRAYVQFVNSVAQDVDFKVGSALLLGNTASAWIEFEDEI